MARRSNLSADLARSVVDMIRRDALQPGDRLPSVRALAERNEVAAPTMREALRGLEASGLIEIRHGSGLYVHDNAQRLVLVNPTLDNLDPQRVIELLDARLLVEPYMAQLAAARATDADVARLDELLNAAAQRLSGADEELTPLNMDFHVTIARLSGRSILSDFIRSLISLYAKEQFVILTIHGDRARDHAQHVEIRDALAARDGDQARALMTAHLEDVIRLVSARLPEIADG